MNTYTDHDTIVNTCSSQPELNFEIIRPLAHLGGSPKQILCEQYHDAAMSVAAAVESIAGLYHGRDFYKWGEVKSQRARDEHDKRVEAMNRVYVELFAMAEALANQ